MKRAFFLLVLLVLIFTSGCMNNGYYNNGYEDDYYDDESYYDDEYSEDDGYYEDDAYADDDEYYEDDEYYDDEGWFDSWLYDSPEDCYEDEYYDEEAQLCFLIEEEYDEYNEPTIMEELLTYVFSYVPGDSFEPSFSDSEEVETSYAVNGDQLVVDQNNGLSADTVKQHQEIWALFTQLIPQDQRTMVDQFGISSDGVEETMAWVEPIDEYDLSSWLLVIDPADAGNPEELTFTLIHEYGHLLTLNDHQIISDAASCSTYEPQEGCTTSNAYLNAFYQKFWVNLYPEIQEIEEESDEDRYYDLLDAFYQEHEDQFVSDYAATNVEEDIAESWSYFVLGQKPDGNSIAEQKILFFYDYPELVDLRGEIIQRTNSRLRRSTQ